MRFVCFRKQRLVAEKRPGWGSRKWGAGPALYTLLCGEMGGERGAALVTSPSRDHEIW